MINFLKRVRAKREYRKGSLMGENIELRATARCFNLTSDKTRISVGANSLLMGRLFACGEGRISIGENFYIGSNSMIGSSNSIKIGNCVIISNDVCIYDNNNHPTSPSLREKMSKEGFSNDNWSWKLADSAPVVIEDNVWIGQYCTVLKGVTIGKGAVVGTRAVVTKDVPPYSIVVGNPAKVVKMLDHGEI